jgi:hypothetical protein
MNISSVKNYRPSWGLFYILIVAGMLTLSVGVYYSATHQRTCSCPAHFGPSEKIVFYSAHVSSPTNVTLTLNNTGSLTVTVAQYRVEDSYGNSYTNSSWADPFEYSYSGWAGPIINPGAVTTVNILLTGTLSGQPFQFQSGYGYTVRIVTTRGFQFSYGFAA